MNVVSDEKYENREEVRSMRCGLMLDEQNGCNGKLQDLQEQKILLGSHF